MTHWHNSMYVITNGIDKLKWNIVPEKQNKTNVWAVSWQNLFMSYANNKDADQPAHPRSLISIFVIRLLDSITSIDAIS